MKFTDSHCHLEQMERPEAALQRAKAQGVERVVAVSEDQASLDKILELRESLGESVLVGAGFHPMFTPGRKPAEIDAALKRIEEVASQVQVIGEVGLDFKYAQSDDEKNYQRDVLRQQLRLAARFKKPVNLHSRWALRETMNEAIRFTQETGLSAQLHWFTQSKKLIRLTNEAGVYVSVGPSLLFSEDCRKVASHIDTELLLLETDGPVPFDGQPGEPAWIPRVAQAVAAIWGCELAEVSRQTEQNFERFLSN